MKRARWVALALVLFSILFLEACCSSFCQRCGCQGENCVSIKECLLRVCPERAPALPQCMDVWTVELRIRSDEPGIEVVPDPTPGPLRILRQDCVLFVAKDVDENPGYATISAINFIDDPSEIPPGKEGKVSTSPLGEDRCTGNHWQCLVPIDFNKSGCFRYHATVKQMGREYSTDPELEVSCGDRCDEPPPPKCSDS